MGRQRIRALLNPHPRIPAGVFTDRLKYIDHIHIFAPKITGQDRAPYINTEGTFKRNITIIIAGSDLSQPASPTTHHNNAPHG